MFPFTPVPSAYTYWDKMLRTGDDGRETQPLPGPQARSNLPGSALLGLRLIADSVTPVQGDSNTPQGPSLKKWWGVYFGYDNWVSRQEAEKDLRRDYPKSDLCWQKANFKIALFFWSKHKYVKLADAGLKYASLCTLLSWQKKFSFLLITAETLEIIVSFTAFKFWEPWH